MVNKEKMVFNDDREPGSSGGSQGTDEAAPGFVDYPNSSFRGGGDKRGGLMKTKKMAEGGKTNPKEIFYDNSEPGSSGGYQGTHNIPTGGGEKRGGLMKTKKMSSGGSASSRADGIATKGKTRGKMC